MACDVEAHRYNIENLDEVSDVDKLTVGFERKHNIEAEWLSELFGGNR